MIKIVKAKYYSEFKIWVEFNDGFSGIVDFNDILWGKIFEPLKEIEKFKKFRISEITNTIEWENGADLAPEYIYQKIIIQ
jgi:hypothetical protein